MLSTLILWDGIAGPLTTGCKPTIMVDSGCNCTIMRGQERETHMRDAQKVYLVGFDADGGSYNGMSTSEMVLLKGNQLLTVEGVLYVDPDEGSMEGAWEEHMLLLADDDEGGITLENVSDEEADELYEMRVVPDFYEDEDEMAD